MRVRHDYHVVPIRSPVRITSLPAGKCQGYLARPPWRCTNNAHVAMVDPLRGRVDLCAECAVIAEEAGWLNVWSMEAA